MRRAVLCAVALLAVSSCRGEPRSAAFTLQDDWHRSVALTAPARRIVSLSPATTELVFALGAGDRLVGRTTWCDWPAAAKQVPDMGNGIGINVEAVAAARPDLVLVYPSEANRSAVQQLDQLGITSAALKQDAIAEWRGTVRWVARALGDSARGDSLLADFDRRLAAVRVPDSSADRFLFRPSVFIAVGANPPIAIGKGSFVSELLELAGGRNAFEEVAGPSAVVSLEAIVAHRPDGVLVLGPDSTIPDVRMRPGWRSIGAVARGFVIAVDGSQFNRPSPRLPEAVAELKRRMFILRDNCRPGGRTVCDQR